MPANAAAYWSPEIQDRARSPFALEGFLIFCILAAARNSGRASRAANSLMRDRPARVGPLTHIHTMALSGALEQRIGETGLGYQAQKAAFLSSAARAVQDGLDLRTASIADLEKIKGVAEKTSRFFRLFSFPNLDLQHAILDVHVLRFIGDYYECVLGLPRPTVPDRTPTGNMYTRWEGIFLAICHSHRRRNPAFDFRVWRDWKADNEGEPEARLRLLKRLEHERTSGAARPLQLPA